MARKKKSASAPVEATEAQPISQPSGSSCTAAMDPVPGDQAVLSACQQALADYQCKDR